MKTLNIHYDGKLLECGYFENRIEALEYAKQKYIWRKVKKKNGEIREFYRSSKFRITIKK